MALTRRKVKNGFDYDIIVMNINWGTEFNGMKAAEQICEYNTRTKIIYMAEDTEKYIRRNFFKPCKSQAVLVKPVNELMLKKIF